MNPLKWRLMVIAGVVCLFFSGCASGIQAAAQHPTPAVMVQVETTQTRLPTPTKVLTSTMVLPDPTLTLTPTPLPTGTPTAVSTSTPAWVYYPAGQIQVPILLYHRISEGEPENRYEVSVENFGLQMEYLSKNGFTTITPVQLSKVILKGGDLPLKPIIVTFDDGYRSVYEFAFPILQQYGLQGVVYVITGYVGAPTYMNADQLVELFANGWEIGSHTVSHEDLVKNFTQADSQMVDSRNYLKKLLGTNFLTIAYPFGKANKKITNLAAKIGFFAGMGLGVSNNHSIETLYFLSRQEIKSDCDLSCFEKIVTGAKTEP
ncbi:MAG: polysaccharide deacetylase family protein [Chloroflexota bacterium]